MCMFSIFRKDPIKKLGKLYESKPEEAMYAKRKSNIKSCAMLSAEAENLKCEHFKSKSIILHLNIRLLIYINSLIYYIIFM